MTGGFRAVMHTEASCCVCAFADVRLPVMTVLVSQDICLAACCLWPGRMEQQSDIPPYWQFLFLICASCHELYTLCQML